MEKFITHFIKKFLWENWDSFEMDFKLSVWASLDSIEERFVKLSVSARKEFDAGYDKRSLAIVKNADAFELLSDLFGFEKKVKEELEMKKDVKKVVEGQLKKEEALMDDIAKKGGELPAKALAVKNELTLAEWETTVNFLYKSGYFTGLQSLQQALAKAQCGRELGFTPFYSLQHLYITPGKPPACDGQAMAALVRGRGYDYRPKETTDSKCTIMFFGRKGEELGEASFTIQEANAITQGGKRLTDKEVWKNYRSDMLFWRAFSRGARRYCPDAIAGVYYVEELDLEIVEGDQSSALKDFQVSGSSSPEGKKDEPKAPQKTRKEMLEELVDLYGKEKVVALKAKDFPETSLKDISNEDFQKFSDKLKAEKEGKVVDAEIVKPAEEPKAPEEPPKEQKKEKKKKEEPKKEEPKFEVPRADKIAKLEELKEQFGVAKIREVKEEMKFEEKIVDLDDERFKQFVSKVSGEKKADDVSDM